MIQIHVTAKEREAGALAPAQFDAALAALQRDGYVALLDLADPDPLERIYHRMIQDITAWDATAEKKVQGGNFPPSREPELLSGQILMNRMIAQILAALMGPEVCCGMYSSNVTLPGKGEQALHVDAKAHQAGDDLSGPCDSVVVNWPLVDFTVENGATELWPGTHRIMREPGEFTVSERLQDQRRPIAPPERAILPRGSALIRDIRLWHRGALNRCDYIRPMIAMILMGGLRPGVDPPERIPDIGPFPASMRSFFTNNPVIHYRPQFVDEELAYAPGHAPRVRSLVSSP